MSLPSGTLNNDEALLHMIKKYNTNELIEYLQNKDLKLDDDDFAIIRKEKIAGLDFFDLTREEFRSIGLALGPATRLIKLITEIKELKMPPHELRQQTHNLNQSGNFQEDSFSDIVEKYDSDTAESKDAETNKFCGPYTALYVNETIFVSETITADLYLPEIASQVLKYYDFWIRPYIEWSLNEFSEHLRNVHNINEKSLIHNSFKKDGGVLKKLLSKEHPAQLRLLELENQLKSQQNKQKKEKTRRRKLTRKSTRCESLKEKIEIAKDSVILGGYNRINEHYDDFHSASSLLAKRNLRIDDDSLEPNLKKAKRNIFQDSDQYDFDHGNVDVD
ncbi:42915_t:CDS:2, partial [Gigaspora margarita]